jgi:flavin reductase (DIM6/NTAB) family NADH-FMN oxidoreductase RutF
VPSKENTRQLRDAFGRFATGVTVITAQFEGRPIAITANSFSSVSLDPPLVLWCPDKKSKRFDAFAAAQHYAIHILSVEQTDLCWRVAQDVSALANMDLDKNLEGIPVLSNCLARFECRQTAIHDAGDHSIVLGQVLRASLATTGTPLAFFGGNIRHMETQG